MDYETLSFILFVLVIAFLLYIKKQKKLITELQNDKTYFETYAKQKDSDFSILKTTCSNLEECIRKKDSDLKYILSGKKECMPYLAGMIADYLTLEYDRSAYYLANKKRPAIKEAQRIAELKRTTKLELQRLKVYEYQLAYIIKRHPILEDELEDNFSSDQEIYDENYDTIRDWLSKEEWLNLPDSKKNQLALDRYISSRKKSKSAIGRDYELYIGQYYQKLGFNVNYHGMENGFNDLGRDLIATKDNQVYIIQCKYWSKYKQIHENSINQLFGSVTAYRIEHENENKKIDGVFITSISLSPIAKKFAEMLNIQVIENMPMKDFPRIKCNIGKNNEKIYHLPMDQQYNKVRIDKCGEFYAYTVQEAESLGFRRAFKYHFNKSS